MSTLPNNLLRSAPEPAPKVPANEQMACFLTQLFISRWAHWTALGVVILAFVLPPDRGFGLALCQFRSVTHVPCLACGLTRSYIALAHLDVGRAVFYHPLGLVLFPFTVGLAALLPTSAATRAALVRWTESRRRPLNYFGIALLVFFLIHGLGRMAWVLQSGRPSPW